MIGLMRLCGAHAVLAHLMQDDALSGLSGLPRGFRACETAADDVKDVIFFHTSQSNRYGGAGHGGSSSQLLRGFGEFLRLSAVRGPHRWIAQQQRLKPIKTTRSIPASRVCPAQDTMQATLVNFLYGQAFAWGLITPSQTERE